MPPFHELEQIPTDVLESVPPLLMQVKINRVETNVDRLNFVV